MPAVETVGVNDRVQLAAAHRVYNDRLLDAHMRAGVTVVDPATTWVDAGVTIDADAIVLPSVDLHGETHVAAGAILGPQVSLTDTTVGAGSLSTRPGGGDCCDDRRPRHEIGPFAYLRPGTVLADDVHVGTYVEIKNSDIGTGTKVPHLSYVGDASIGEHTNIGAATVFVNYDGVAKHRSVIGDHARTGADNMFVAPVQVGDGAYTAAGAVVTGDVPPGALARSTARQQNVAGWVAQRRPGTAAAEAAARTRGTLSQDRLEPVPEPARGRGLMSTLHVAGRKSLVLLSGGAYPELADEIAAQIGVTLTETTRREFANGELFIRPNESVRGTDAFVIQSFTTPINTWVMETLILVDALKRASAKRITVVAPFYPYARQDKKHRGREPISARLVADLFKTAGADRVMAVDLHTAQIQGFFDGPVDHLFALPLLADYIADKYGDRDMTVVSPDTGRVRSAEQWADALGGRDIAFVHKTRDIDAANETVANRVVGEVSGRVCLLIDDMIDTGGSITKAADLLFENGATDVVIAATHGIFSPPATDRLKNSRVSEIVVTNTLPVRAEQQFDKLTVLSIAPLLGKAIKEVFEDGSVTSLFAAQLVAFSGSPGSATWRSGGDRGEGGDVERLAARGGGDPGRDEPALCLRSRPGPPRQRRAQRLATLRKRGIDHREHLGP